MRAETSFPFRVLVWLAPLLWATLPVSYLYSQNPQWVPVFSSSLSSFFGMLLACWGVAAVAILGVGRFTNAPLLWTLWSSCIVIWFFGAQTLTGDFDGSVRWIANLAGLGIGLYLCIGFDRVVRSKSVGCNFLAIVPFVVLSFHLGQIIKEASFSRSLPVRTETHHRSAEGLPNIYYLVVDAYGSAGVLNEFYGFDNNPFLTELKRHGFFVAQDAKSNYPYTLYSIASLLNMDYIHQKFDRSDRSLRPLLELIQNNRAERLLRENAYHPIYIPSATLKFKTGIKCRGLNPFAEQLIDSTLVADWVRNFEFFQKAQKHPTLCAFEALEQAVGIQKGVFVFAHILPPHEPFLFMADGSWNDGRQTKPSAAYIEQLRYVNKRLLAFVRKVIQKDPESIVVIHSDHGPNYTPAWKESDGLPSDRMLRERFGILNAFRVPRSIRKKLTNDMSPVNNLRFLFTHLFGLTDRLRDNEYIWASTESARPYTFTEITNRLKPTPTMETHSPKG